MAESLRGAGRRGAQGAWRAWLNYLPTTVSVTDWGMMALPLEKLGGNYDGGTRSVDPGRSRAYAAATNDRYPGYELGRCAPPVFGAVLAWDAVRSAVIDVVPPHALPTVVHGEQDMHFHQPIVPGACLATTALAHSVRVAGSGTSYTVRATSVDAGTGTPVLDQYLTVFLRGLTAVAGAGPDKPAHSFPSHATPVGEAAFHVDDDQTLRYAAASGDDLAVHVDDGAARSVGLPGMIVQGLCTLAMAGCAVLGRVSDGDPVPLRRLAVRFAANVFPGDEVVVAIHRMDGAPGRRRHPFHARTADGRGVLEHGLVEVDA